MTCTTCESAGSMLPGFLPARRMIISFLTLEEELFGRHLMNKVLTISAPKKKIETTKLIILSLNNVQANLI